MKVGLRPTYKSGSAVDNDSGLVECFSDPDRNGVFRISDKDTQKFIIVQTGSKGSKRQEFTLSDLVLAVENG